MSKALVIVLAIGLGVVHGHVIKRQAPDAAPGGDIGKILTDLQKQIGDFAPQVNNNFGANIDWTKDTNLEHQKSAADILGGLQTLFMQSNTSTGQATPLDALGNFLGSGLQIPGPNTGENMTDDQFLTNLQHQTFLINNATNAEIRTSLDPDVVSRYARLEQTLSNPDIMKNLSQNDVDAMSRQFAEYYNRKRQEIQTGNQVPAPSSSRDFLGVVQDQITKVSSMYNTELGQILQPDAVKGALTTGPQLENTVNKVYNVVTKVFETLAANREQNHKI